jgi:hypothetical protein
MSLMTGITAATYGQFGGSSDTLSSVVEIALQIAWDEAEEFLGTQLYPYPINEERHDWPLNGKVTLKMTHVGEILAVRAIHSGRCQSSPVDLNVDEVDLVDPMSGIVDVSRCSTYRQVAPCYCSADGMGRQLEIDYVAGLEHPLRDDVKLALTLLAKDVVPTLTMAEEEFATTRKISSFSSNGYSESYDDSSSGRPFVHTSRAEMARNLLRKYRKIRPIGFGRPRKAGMLR